MGERTNGAYNLNWAIRGVFYRFNYILNDRYIFETNGRYDGTSRFPTEDRFDFFPSASLAWVVSEESFFKPLKKVVSYMKFRGSAGTLGNQNLGEDNYSQVYPYISTMGLSAQSTLLNGAWVPAVYAPNLVSASLTWEKATTYNFGVDLGLLNDKLNATFDLYRRNTVDMLTKGKTLPAVLGTSVPKENAADLETNGWELTLNWKDQMNVAGKPFHYGVKFILYDSRTYITKFDNPTNYLDDHYEGMEWGDIWGLKTLGFFQSEQEIEAHADQSKVASYPGSRPIEPGDLKFEDTNGDGIVDWGNWTLENPGDYRIIGNSQDRLGYSIDLNAEWNGFDLRAFFQGIGKKDFYPGPGHHYFWGIYAQPWSNLLAHNLDHWTPESPNAYFPRPKSYSAEIGKELGIPQSKYLQNAAYLRLKNLTLGYSLPKSLISKIGLDKVRLYVSGENLLEFTKLNEYLDPEGLGGTVYPFQRTYSFGLNVIF
ncbi:SusC/RagA family TonB-linked outer membrane protein [Rapidithrix thailandica]|uniref:SusC/RagA family TonB-linked outer membrane protein n=1 Tax=Rapidithrix thailandica TaxID=413964 RepID=A0AAW9SB66_9BACT